ncbi:hypothetical protein EJ994_13055 [Maribacter sp. MJ134]|uniref:O-antigen ligase family protein n=1 Tax=Maribacter sp. MJ134 TaxID=2496865 RepID=UPI000F81664B|nr:O-antigen ligase family protein [Maribacter sp. MJ134]AZQ59687.1 hypothetical protein EJ994_13055 [Maribacter sp. MJ134]
MYFGQIKHTIYNSLKKYNKSELVLAAMIFGIPFTINFGNALLIVGVIFSLYGFRSKFGACRNSRIPYFLIFPTLLFLMILLSAMFSKDVHAGLVQVEKNILFIIIPLALYLLSYNRKTDYSLLFKVFVIANFTITLILILAGVFRIIDGETYEVLFFHELGSILDLHPVYIALSISISMFYITQYHIDDTIIQKKRGLFVIALLSYFYMVLFLCASKSVIIIFTLIYVFQLFSVIRKQKIKLFALLAITALMVNFFSFSMVSDRFIEGLHFNILKFEPTEKIENAKVFTNKEKEEISDLELRYIMFKIGLFHTIKENKWIWGYGIGDVQDHIDFYYMIYGLAPGWFEGYNLHNQYVQYFVSYGLMGTIFFLVYLVYSVILALRTNNKLALLFLFLVVFIFLFESLLSRNKGIVIFLFFNTLFIIQSLNENRDIGNQRNSK